MYSHKHSSKRSLFGVYLKAVEVQASNWEASNTHSDEFPFLLMMHMFQHNWWMILAESSGQVKNSVFRVVFHVCNVIFDVQQCWRCQITVLIWKLKCEMSVNALVSWEAFQRTQVRSFLSIWQLIHWHCSLYKRDMKTADEQCPAMDQNVSALWPQNSEPEYAWKLQCLKL